MTDQAQAFDLASYMKPISESAKYLKMLIYGPPKVGKTTFAATAPSTLFLTVEPGTVTLLKKSHGDRFKDTLTAELKNVSGLKAITNALRQGQVPDRKTIVLDTLTEFEKRVQLQWQAQAMKRGLTKNQNPFALEWPEYNAVTNILRQCIWNLRDVERHIIILCHVRDDPDKNKGGLRIDRPGMSPSLGGSLSAMFNLVGFMTRDGGITKLQVEPDSTTVAGSHIWEGEPVVENPTFDMFASGVERAI